MCVCMCVGGGREEIVLTKTGIYIDKKGRSSKFILNIFLSLFQVSTKLWSTLTLVIRLQL